MSGSFIVGGKVKYSEEFAEYSIDPGTRQPVASKIAAPIDKTFYETYVDNNTTKFSKDGVTLGTIRSSAFMPRTSSQVVSGTVSDNIFT